jgi:exonuclease SbcC
MKFLSIEIENIASLKGKHKIDFQDIENYTNVFAITGDTGSGKSTILNCLSLAFYGQNYKKSLNQMDFITLNESKGAVSVCTELDGSIYKFNWSCRLKKKNGEDLKNPKPKREYFKRIKDSWEPIEESPEEIIKLSFDQFCKTIILNQGDFAKFLTSSFGDRKEILERFYEGINLDKISTIARQNLNAVKEKIALLNSKIQGLTHKNEDDLNKPQLEKAINEKNSTNKELEQLNSNLKSNSVVIRDILKTDQTIQTSKERLKKVKVDLEEITKTHNLAKVSLDKINNKVSGFNKIYTIKEPIYRTGIKKKEKIDQLTIQKERVRIEYQKGEESNKKINERLKESTESIKKKEDEKKNIHIKIKELPEQETAVLEKEIKLYITSIQSVEIKKRDLLGLTNTNVETQKEAEAIKQKNEQLDVDGIDSKIKIIKNRIDAISKQKEAIKETTQQLSIIEKQYNDIKQQISVYKKDITLKKSEIEKISKDKITLENDIENLETSIKYYDLVESIHNCQEQTVIDGKCVVCNSTSLDRLPNIDIEGLEKRADLKAQKEDKHLILRQIERTNENIKGKLSTIETENNVRLEKYKELGEQRKALLVKEESFNNESSQVISKDDMEQKLEILNKTKNEAEFNSKQIEQLRQKFKENKEKSTVLRGELEEIETRLNTKLELIKAKSDSDLAHDELLIELEKMNKKRVISEQIITLNKMVSSITEELTNLTEQQQQRKTFEAETLTEIDLLKASIKSTCESNDPEGQLKDLNKQKDELFHEKDKVKEQYNRVEIQKADASSRFKNFTEQIESSKDLINSTIVDLNFDLSSTIIDKYDYAILSSLKKLKTYDQINFESLSESFESLKEFESTNDQLRKKNKDELVRLQTKLDQLLDVEQKMGKIEKELELLTNEKNQLSDLYDIVGADQFRNFVLSNIEKNLIDQTNVELGKLCDERYQIVQFKKNAKSTPEFYIIDRYKAGLNRKITTLSGGETFMVSLAMALALSELTRGTREIDTLFIDEGFGTLDEESLEDVVEMLLSMSNRGKTVGLITHVKRLSERIAVNIHLQKSQQGNSTIELKYQ